MRRFPPLCLVHVAVQSITTPLASDARLVGTVVLIGGTVMLYAGVRQCDTITSKTAGYERMGVWYE